MRASVVRSGCWNTVTRTASPTPSLSPVCSCFCSPCCFSETAGLRAGFCGPCFCALPWAPEIPGHAIANTTNPIRMRFIEILARFSDSLPFEIAHILDARQLPQPLHFRGGELQSLAPGQELLDERRGLLLAERRVLHLHQLHHGGAERRAEHCDVALLHPGELRQ